LADFTTGESTRPDVPEEVSRAIVPTTDGRWVVWAYKVARPAGEGFRPLNPQGGWYSHVASARCWRGAAHAAPQPDCTCGFHAVSSSLTVPVLPRMPGIRHLEVALFGRVLAFAWAGGGILFRAAEQAVVTIDRRPALPPARRLRRPGDQDPHGARRRPQAPRGSGPVRLELPRGPRRTFTVQDDAGWCNWPQTAAPTLPAARVPAYA
jgi:hypothetical protein